MYDYVVSRKRLSENKVHTHNTFDFSNLTQHAAQARWIFQQLVVAVDYLHKMVR